MIHAVVVAFRSAGFIAPCLESLLSDPGVCSVAVVDNSREDATRRVCELMEDDRLNYLPSANVGYAAACNRGSTQSSDQADHIAILNPDVVLEGRLSCVTDHARDHPGSIFSAVLEQPSGVVNFRPMATLGREVARAMVGTRAYTQPDHWRAHGAVEFMQVHQIDGSLLLLAREEWSALGGFDERYELYYEDVDLCRRANGRGGCFVWTERIGFHRAGSSFAAAGSTPYTVMRVSRMRYLRRWYGVGGNILGVVLGGLECVVRTAGRKNPSFRAAGRALGAQIREVFPKTRGRRYLSMGAASRE